MPGFKSSADSWVEEIIAWLSSGSQITIQTEFQKLLRDEDVMILTSDDLCSSVPAAGPWQPHIAGLLALSLRQEIFVVHPLSPVFTGLYHITEELK